MRRPKQPLTLTHRDLPALATLYLQLCLGMTNNPLRPFA
jgi:hypothetical protein